MSEADYEELATGLRVIPGQWRPHHRFEQIAWISPAIAALPVMATVSDRAERLVAFTWYGDTYSLIGNTRRPCMHADPHFLDLLPGKRGEIHGAVIFFEGDLESFTECYQKKWYAAKVRAAQ